MFCNKCESSMEKLFEQGLTGVYWCSQCGTAVVVYDAEGITKYSREENWKYVDWITGRKSAV